MSLCGPPPCSTQIQAGSEGAGSGPGGQPPVQTGVWGQDWESADGGGAPEETEVGNVNSALFVWLIWWPSCGFRMFAIAFFLYSFVTVWQNKPER